MSTTATVETLTARELVISGRCSGACLVGDEDEVKSCTCRCGGRYHGALANCAVAACDHGGHQWWELCDRGGWTVQLQEDLSTVITSPTLRTITRNIRDQKDARGYWHATIRRRGKWDVEWDCAHRWVSENPNTPAAFRRFARELLVARRVSTSIANFGEWGQLTGIASLDEARTIECLIGESLVDNPCGTVRAVWALHGRNLDALWAEGGHPEKARFPDSCGSCGQACLYDAVEDRYLHPGDTARNAACTLTLLRGGLR